MTYLTPQLLQALKPDLDGKTAEVVAAKLEAALIKFGVITSDPKQSKNRVAHVLSQLAHESGLRPVRENLNYTAEGLLKTWPSRFTPDMARRCAGNPALIANTVYANRMGNGDAASGEGALFAGRGFIQITGRENYVKYGGLIGHDLDKDPDLALQIGVGCLIVGAYFAHHKAKFGDGKYYGGLELMDRGESAVSQVTYFVNGGQHGLPERGAYYKQALKLLGGTDGPTAPATPQSGPQKPAPKVMYPVRLGKGPNDFNIAVGGFKDDAYYAEIGSAHPAQDFNINRGPGENGDKEYGKPYGAMQHGKVISVKHHRYWGWITLIEVDNLDAPGTPLVMQYAHSKEVLVKVGQYVNAGDIIGTIGKGGPAAAGKMWSHLHGELRKFAPPSLVDDFWPSSKYPRKADAYACIDRNYMDLMAYLKRHGAANPNF